MYRLDSLKGLRAKLFVAAFVFFAAVGTALATPDASWQGVVLSDNVKVYIDPSSTSRLVTILTPGVHVTILVEIEASGIQWCRVQLPSETEPLGYVNCSGIQRGSLQGKRTTQKNPVATTAPSATDSVPISLERRPEQPSAPTTGSAVISTVGNNPAPTGGLTNGDILSMTKTGLPADVLLAKIKSSTSKFDTSPAELSQLKTAGVADGVILAMVQAPTGASASPVVQAAAVVPTVSSPSPPPAIVVPPAGSSSSGAAGQVRGTNSGKRAKIQCGQYEKGRALFAEPYMKTVSEEVECGEQVTVVEPDYKCAVSSCAHVRTDDDKDGYMLTGAFMNGGGETEANIAEKESTAKKERPDAAEEKQLLKEDKKAEHLCQKHSNWKIGDCRQITQGHVFVGMTEEMLYATVGRPSGSSTVDMEQTEDGIATTIVYDFNMRIPFGGGETMGTEDRYFTVVLSNGIVTRFRSTSIAKY
jgi:hypothetical protein